MKSEFSNNKIETKCSYPCALGQNWNKTIRVTKKKKKKKSTLNSEKNLYKILSADVLRA